MSFWSQNLIALLSRLISTCCIRFSSPQMCFDSAGMPSNYRCICIPLIWHSNFITAIVSASIFRMLNSFSTLLKLRFSSTLRSRRSFVRQVSILMALRPACKHTSWPLPTLPESRLSIISCKDWIGERISCEVTAASIRSELAKVVACFLLTWSVRFLRMRI